MRWLDPDYLREVSGTVEQFSIDPHGDAESHVD
jgi:hypothetical protein